MDTSNVINNLRANGWSVFQLLDPQPVYEARSDILGLLQEVTKQPNITLETYHEFLDDDLEHYETQTTIANFARSQGYAKKILYGQLELFQKILGPDISMTTTNNWRIARPDKPQDNIGFHRDIEVGHTAFEVNLWFPLVTVDEKSGMQLMPGSHLMPRADFPYEKVTHETVTQGSDRHKLGFMYASQIYDSWFKSKMSPVPVQLGHGLMFFAPVMHGQEINSGLVTRWSTDFVIANSQAPIDWTHHGDEAKYEIISESIAVEVGKIFHEFPY